MKARARRLYAAGLSVLVCGLAAAAFAYFAAADESAGSLYVIVDGQPYAVDPGSSKTYVRDLRRFGGQASVLFDEFNRLFESLWRGSALAGTRGPVRDLAAA